MFDLSMLCKLYVTGFSTIAMPDFHQNAIYNIKRPHLNHGIAFGLSGSIQFNHKGNSYVCDKNHAILIPSDTEYSYMALENGSSLALINFFTTEEFHLDEFHLFKIENMESFIADHAAMHKNYTVSAQTSTIECLIIFYKMLTRFINTVGLNQSQSSAWHITEYIVDHLDSPDLTVSSIAQAAGFSEVHFRKLFKNFYGVSPKQYVQNMRIDKAKKLLESNNDAISKIASQCGFSTIFYFSKLFKDKTGYSPYEYRERYRKLF